MDPFLSSILAPLCQRVIDAAIGEYRLVRDVKEEIRNLSTKVSMIKGVLDDAEKKQIEHDGIRKWLKSLKQVLLDADDVLDEIATNEALGIRRDAVTRRLSKVRKFISCLCSVDHSSSSRAIAHRVKDINKQFDDISNNKDMLGLHVLDVTSWSEIRKRPPGTSSLLHPNEAHIIGRDDEMQKIEDLLLLDYSAEGTKAATTSDDKNNVQVISVVGMGGVGKTTLVKHAYNRPTVEKYFQLRMWVCVSNDFDVERVTREIMAAIGSSTSDNWDAVQKHLQGTLEGKRFLLVLDDVWEENSSKWERLCTPLMYGGKGSKIIVTTRSQKVSNSAKVRTPIFLKDLSREYLWTIFQTYAFDGHDLDKHTQLVLVGRQIVKRLKGSPLAAKTIGRLLNSNLDVKHWTNIMKSEAWVSPDSEESIVPILKLSYDHLPGHLKQCFAYCSLFPEDHGFRKHELVQLWMAQQFIRIREGSNIESEGGKYFDNLVYMSLFEKCTYVKEAYVMHDLIHNLAELVSKDDCLRLEDNQHERTIFETVRHVSIASYRFDMLQIEQLIKYENMRTLLFLRGCKFQRDTHLGNIFTRLRRLRVLGLRGCRIKELPASIGALKHLRFLDLSCNDFEKLPESLCNLDNLQVLNLEGCYSLSALPRNMSALINLRHLNVSKDELVSGIQGLGKLTALHELGGFDCARQPMKELADMGMLRRLRITSLEAVKSREEAAGSILDKKEHLDDLTLEWGGRGHHVIHTGMEEEVLDGLQPPASSIRRLSIWNYGGIRSPSWMEDQSWIRDSYLLERLEFVRCKSWEVLPPLGQLLCLDSLKIRGMTSVRRIGPAFMGAGCCHALEEGAIDQVPFPSLQVLEFKDMEEWEEWEVPPKVPRRQHLYHHPLFLPLLRKLIIWDCPKLRQLPPLPPTLTKLRLQNVGLSGDLPGWSDCSSSSSSSYSLISLKIKHCPDLTSLAGGLLRHPLPNLVKLIIQDCRGLVSLPETAFGHLTSLKELEVRSCPRLSWPSCESVEDTLPPSLERITIEGEDAGEAATGHMMLALIIGSQQKLTCLRYLSIGGCRFSWPPPPPPTLVGEFGRLPSSLQELTIHKSDHLDDETLSALLRGLTSLKSLSISQCPAVTSLPRAEGVHSLPSLETLIILDCPGLLDVIMTAAADSSSPSSSAPLPHPAGMGTTTQSVRALEIIGQSSMQQIRTWLLQCPSLQRLYITDCPQLTGFGGINNDGVGGELEAALLNLSGTLRQLAFRRCVNLRSLPPRLRCLSSLEYLEMKSCRQIPSLPAAGLPESLQSLNIRGCPALQKRCKKGEGSDWPLISHIPAISVWRP